jgi:ketosteroid isomerase-like protein
MKLLFSAALLMAAMNNHGQSAPPDDMARLRSLNATFIHNFVTNDTVSHSKIIHPAFVCINSLGRKIERKEYLQDWLHGFDGFVYWDYRDEQISIYGNTALVRSQNKYVFMKDGKEVTGMSMYTDTYIKENGEWKCVQAQLLRVSPENYSSDETIVRKYDFRK